MKFSPVIAMGGAALYVTFAAGNSAFAQTAATISAVPGAGQALQGAKEAQQAAPRPVVAAPVLPKTAEPLFTLKDKTTLLIRHFTLDGENPLTESEVHDVLVPYENRKLTLAEIYEAADKVTSLLRDNGYLLAKAYVPLQDARNGTLRIKLLPGKYGEITVKNESLVRDEFVRGVIDHAVEGSPYVRNRELDRAMLLIADMAGSATPHIAVGAGRQPETSDVAFSVPEGRRFNGYLLADNFGAGYFGRDRVTGGLFLNSPLGYGDQLSGFGMASAQASQVNGRLTYAFPLGYDGLHGEIAGFRNVYTLRGIFRDLDITGFVNGGSATLTYALIRSSDRNLYISGTFTHEGLDDRIFGISFRNRTIDLGTATITHESVGMLPFLNLPMTTNGTLSLTTGYVNYVDADQKLLDSLGFHIQGNYARVNLTAGTTIALDEKWSFSASLRAQKSLSGTLDAAEGISLTGFSGVRSYDEGLVGDSGLVATPELKYALPDIYNYRHALGVFTDIGAAWLENTMDLGIQKAFTPLDDVGLSYNGTYEYSPARSLLVKAYFAHTYGANATYYDSNTYNRHTRGMVQLGITF